MEVNYGNKSDCMKKRFEVLIKPKRFNADITS